MRQLLLCLVILFPAQAFAQAWIAQMEEDEGGPVMVASVAGEPEDGLVPALRLMCAGTEGINLRYEMAGDESTPGDEADFLFENESMQATLHMVYEDFDGAFAAYFPPSDPILGLLENGAEVVVSRTVGNSAARSFPLESSRKAIDTLLRTCS